jgi:hypothetical protein
MQLFLMLAPLTRTGLLMRRAAMDYRRSGSRGPASTLLYDRQIVRDPVAWLTERVGRVAVNR